MCSLLSSTLIQPLNQLGWSESASHPHEPESVGGSVGVGFDIDASFKIAFNDISPSIPRKVAGEQNCTGTTVRENLLFAPNRRCIHLRSAFASVALQEKYNSTLPSDFAFGVVALSFIATASALQYAM